MDAGALPSPPSLVGFTNSSPWKTALTLCIPPEDTYTRPCLNPPFEHLTLKRHHQQFGWSCYDMGAQELTKEWIGVFFFWSQRKRLVGEEIRCI
jgi:hypothetical protein